MVADSIFQPGVDAGLIYDRRPDRILTPIRAAKVRQIAACENDLANRFVLRRLEPRWRWPGAPPVFRIASSLVTLKNAEYRNNSVRIGGKWLLSGAAGSRIWTRYALKHSAEDLAATTAIIARQRQTQPIRARGDAGGKLAQIPFAVDLRNGYNFYHFLTEGLPQISLIARAESDAPINIHLPKLSDLKGFIQRFIDTIYPQLSGRILFSDQNTRYDAVRAVYQHRHYLYQVDDSSVQAELAGIDPDDPWRALDAGAASRGFVAKSSIDDGQALLAKDVRTLIDAAAPFHWPERALIMRDPNSGARDREDQRRPRFERALKAMGFEVLYLERMSPLEQMSLWSRARMIVSPHGAAFAQMFFAQPTAEIVEIGTPQTQVHRWGDFLQNAHVSRCRYTTIFSDVSKRGYTADGEMPVAPAMTTGHLGIRYSDQTIAAIEERVAAVTITA